MLKNQGSKNVAQGVVEDNSKISDTHEHFIIIINLAEQEKPNQDQIIAMRTEKWLVTSLISFGLGGFNPFNEARLNLLYTVTVVYYPHTNFGLSWIIIMAKCVMYLYKG